MKIKALDPMRRDYRGKEDDSVNEIVHGDYDDIRKSNVILANCARPSWGTAMEIHEAFEAGGKVVIGVVPKPPISPWLRYHTHAIYESLDAAIDYVIEIARGCGDINVYLCGGINGLTDSECNDWRAHCKQRFSEVSG